MRPKVLLVEDSTSLAVLYKQYVKDEPYDIFHVETARKLRPSLKGTLHSLLFLTLNCLTCQAKKS